MRWLMAVSLCVLLQALPAGAGARDIMVGGVPLPEDIAPLSETQSPFAGTWIGTWDNVLKTILVVESVTGAGEAKVVYAIGESPGRFDSQWARYEGSIDDGTLHVEGRNADFRFTLSPTGRLRGVYGDNAAFAVLERRDLDSITNGGGDISWTIGASELLETELVEDGKPVQLEVVFSRPRGDGPFPLAVMSHGSTGFGTDESIAKLTWSNAWLADFLNERGWIVAFPQRRGRGKSDGLYDEGFRQDRARGYSCNTATSLAGAERALEDLNAAINVLRERKEVSDDPVLLGGVSRGGALSIAYAGRHPEQIHGSINFVGGWMGDRCRNAVKINQTLLNEGAGFKDETLWLYGRDDQYYSVDHTRENFAAFTKAGGSGEYLEVTVPGTGNGHWVTAIPPLWMKPVSEYLDAVAQPQEAE